MYMYINSFLSTHWFNVYFALLYMCRSKEYAGDYEKKRTVMNKAQEETTFSFQKKKVKFMYMNTCALHCIIHVHIM